MSSRLDYLTRDVDAVTAAHVAHFYEPTVGYAPGSFTEQLIKTIVLADPENRQRLAFGFPLYVYAITACKDVEGGLERIIEIAAGSADAEVRT